MEIRFVSLKCTVPYMQNCELSVIQLELPLAGPLFRERPEQILSGTETMHVCAMSGLNHVSDFSHNVAIGWDERLLGQAIITRFISRVERSPFLCPSRSIDGGPRLSLSSIQQEITNLIRV